MHSHRFAPSALRKQIAVLIVGLFAALTLVALPTQGANAVSTRSKPDKVTICHRTHATTNPYRMITVSTNAADGDLHTPTTGNEPNGADGDHAGTIHNGYVSANPNDLVDTNTHYVTLGGVQIRVFDPSYTYAANNKVWEDIIPPFTVTRNSTVLKYPGFNWNAIGKAIYYGQTYNGVDYSGLCGTSGAKQFAQKEYNSWLADNPGATDTQKNNKKQEIVNDVKDQKDVNEGPFTGNENLDDLPSEDPKPKGPNKPQNLNDLQTSLDNNNNPSNNPTVIKQALAGVVWKDMNNNGIQDNGEKAFPSVAISVKDPVTGKELTSSDLGLTPGTDYSLTSYMSNVSEPQVFSFANFFGGIQFHTAVNTVTVTTDANGYFQIPYLPDGEWQIVVTTPDGWSYTYDSNGGADGNMPGTIVPVGGVGFAWAGLVYTGPGTYNEDGTITPALANTGMNGQWYIAGVIGLELIVTGAILLLLRRTAAAKQRP